MEDELVDKILDEVWFERQFYESIAGTEHYDVIGVEAHSKGPTPGKESIQRKAIEAQCERSGIDVLYRISYGDYAVVIHKGNTDRIGIVPETNPDGWEC